jgi:putative DNA methylase
MTKQLNSRLWGGEDMTQGATISERLTAALRLRLLRYAEYPIDWSPEIDARTPVWEALHQLIRALQSGGESASGALLAKMPARTEAIRQLAYRLYTLCERQGRAEEARAYNELITSWEAIEAASHTTGHVENQLALNV